MGLIDDADDDSKVLAIDLTVEPFVLRVRLDAMGEDEADELPDEDELLVLAWRLLVPDRKEQRVSLLIFF